MNRATKRMLAKQQAAADKDKAKARQQQQQLKAPVLKEPLRKRLPRFLREARQELRKVSWPSRREVFVYSLVVLIAVSFLTAAVFAMDFGFGKAVIQIYGDSGAGGGGGAPLPTGGGGSVPGLP